MQSHAHKKAHARVTLIDYVPGNSIHRERFGALNREWLTKYFYVEPHDEAMFADPETIVLGKGKDGTILFAEAEGNIVGTGGLLRLRDGSFELVRMAVTEDYQGCGIGEQILAALLERVRAKGVKKVFIVSNTLLENAIRLYRRHGFKDSAENRHTHYARGNITLELAL